MTSGFQQLCSLPAICAEQGDDAGELEPGQGECTLIPSLQTPGYNAGIDSGREDSAPEESDNCVGLDVVLGLNSSSTYCGLK